MVSHNTSLGCCLEFLTDEAYAASISGFDAFAKSSFGMTWTRTSNMQTGAAHQRRVQEGFRASPSVPYILFLKI
jgi:hypothetical protein